MPEYIFTYKCRYCGEKFGDIRTGNEPRAFANLINISCGLHADSCYLYNVHITKDHYGFADLIGCEITGESETNEEGKAIFKGICPYTNKKCDTWTCRACKVEERERKFAEGDT